MGASAKHSKKVKLLTPDSNHIELYFNWFRRAQTDRFREIDSGYPSGNSAARQRSPESQDSNGEGHAEEEILGSDGCRTKDSYAARYQLELSRAKRA